MNKLSILVFFFQLSLPDPYLEALVAIGLETAWLEKSVAQFEEGETAERDVWEGGVDQLVADRGRHHRLGVRVGVTPGPGAGGGLPVLTAAVHRVRQLLDLQADVAAVELHQLQRSALQSGFSQ